MGFFLSTCVWCRRVKNFLDNLGIEYDYIYVDKTEGAEREEVGAEIVKWNPRVSYPTLVINDNICVVGHNEDEIKEALGL